MRAEPQQGDPRFLHGSSLIPHLDPLFCKPSICIEQLNTDSSLAVYPVGPGSVNFRVKCASEWRSHSHDGTDRYLGVDHDGRSATANLDGLRFNVEGFTRDSRAFDFQGKLDRNSRTARPLGTHNRVAGVIILHYFFTAQIS